MITEVKVYPLKKEHKTIKANGTVVIDGKYKVRVTVRTGEKGLWVGLPGHFDETKKDENNKPVWYSDFQAITTEAHKEIKDAVLNQYASQTGSQPSSQGEAAGPDNQDSPPF